MSKKPASSPWNRRPVTKSGKKKASTAAFKRRTGVRVISNDRPRRKRSFRPPSYLALGIVIACVLLSLSYMDKFGLGYTDPETGLDKRAASVLKGTITHVRDGDTFEVKGVPIPGAPLTHITHCNTSLLTLIVNRRPCWQPNLIVTHSKKTASGISPVEFPQIKQKSTRFNL